MVKFFKKGIKKNEKIKGGMSDKVLKEMAKKFASKK